ncbi:major facilitator superfamily transporter [Fusarium subglutinans]|uniref:Major facilitator superfamily transporter n=1 Tax=Gibberella subglutinans TaxID=42677 RepID=A0A8H5Q8I8_GIBSU|nr:major facilitator superfamily transporter [Fusarium subglutinans]KAF5609428.1 major facilitator superfamily transporter [Fusarium subglutinans]
MESTSAMRLPIVIFVALGSLSYGYASSIIATTLGQPTFLSYFALDSRPNANDLMGAINGLFQAGGFLGTLSCYAIADSLGRRKAILTAALISTIGGALQAGSVNIAMFIASRFITGIGIGKLADVLRSEMSPSHIRGLLVGIHGGMIGTGYALASYVGLGFYFVKASGAQWRIPLAIQCLPSLLLAVGILFLRETPRWLILVNRIDEARDSFNYTRLGRRGGTTSDEETTDADFETLRRQTICETEQNITFLDLLKTPSMRKRCITGFLTTFGCQATATIVINNYGPLLYASLGFNTVQQLLIQCGWITVAPFGNFINAFLVDHVGRVKMLLGGFAGCIVALIGECITMSVFEKTNHRGAASGAVFFLFLHVTIFTLCCDATSYVYASEIFPTPVRAKGLSISVSGLFFATIIFTTAAPTAFAAIGWKFYLVFIGTTSIIIAYAYATFPETSKMSLEDIQELFGDPIEGMPTEVAKQETVHHLGKDDEKKSINVGELRKAWYTAKVGWPPSKQLVETLQLRIKILEDQLVALGQTIPALEKSPRGADRIVENKPKPDQVTADETEDLLEQITKKCGSLALDDDGELRFFSSQSNLNLVHKAGFGLGELAKPASCGGIRLSQAVTLPLELQEHLLELYFCWQNPWVYIVEKSVFMRDWQSDMATEYCTPLLLWAIYSVAARYSDRPCLRTHPDDPATAGIQFAVHAKDLLRYECEVTTISAVQAAALLSIQCMAENKEPAGWLYIGMATRMAFNLGLNLDCTDLVKSGLISKEAANDASEYEPWAPTADIPRQVPMSCSRIPSIANCMSDHLSLIVSTLDIIYAPKSVLSATELHNLVSKTDLERFITVGTVSHTFTAATIHLMDAVSSQPFIRRGGNSKLRLCFSALQEMGTLWTWSFRACRAIQLLAASWATHDLDLKSLGVKGPQGNGPLSEEHVQLASAQFNPQSASNVDHEDLQWLLTDQSFMGDPFGDGSICSFADLFDLDPWLAKDPCVI